MLDFSAIKIKNIKNIYEAADGDLSWLSSKYLEKDPEIFDKYRGSFLISPPLPTKPKVNYKIIEHENPKLCFAKIVNNLFAPATMLCRISNQDIIVGQKFECGENVVIGSAGFGYVDNPITGETIRFPHLGRVIIGDNVSIHSNTCIDRGAISDTIIGNNVKIDNLVHIAHNVKIGDNTKVVAGSVICGSVTIGKNCWIGAKSVIMNGLTIGDNVTIGIGSVVIRDVPSNTIVAGNPAKPLNKHKIKLYPALCEGWGMPILSQNLYQVGDALPAHAIRLATEINPVLID